MSRQCCLIENADFELIDNITYPVPYKNLETRSEHRKILPISDLVQTWCMFRLDMDMSESGLRRVWILSQKQICSRSDSDLEHIWVRSEQICTRSESGLEQICFCDRIHTCLSPDSDMSMSKRNMHHVWTRSDKGKILRCSDLVSKFFLDRFPLTIISKRLLSRSIQGSKNSFDQFFFANKGEKAV